MYLYKDIPTGSADYSTQRSELQKAPPDECVAIWFK